MYRNIITDFAQYCKSFFIFLGKHFKMRIAIPGCICYNIYYHAGFVHR